MLVVHRTLLLALFLLVVTAASKNGQTAGSLQRNTRHDHTTSLNQKGPQKQRRAVDNGISELKALVQQQAQQIQALQAELSAEKLRVDALESRLQKDEAAQQARLDTLNSNITSLVNSADISNKQVAFTARYYNDNIQLGFHSTLKFDVIVTNAGNGYSPQTGVFTAPLAGVYAFFLTFMTSNDHDAVTLAIEKQGTILDLVYADGSADSNDQGSSQVTVRLAGGEQVWVRHHGGDTVVRGDAWTVFTGFLLQAD